MAKKIKTRITFNQWARELRVSSLWDATKPENREFIKFKISILETKKTQNVNYELFPLYQKMVELDPNDKVMTYNYAVQMYNMAVSFHENENKPMTDEYAKKAEFLIENYLKLQKDSDGIFESLKRKVKLLYLQ